MGLAVADLLRAYRARAVSPVEVTDWYLARIEEHNRTLHAFVVATVELAQRQAADAEAAYRRGETAPLLGVPVSVKDLFPLQGAVTTFGSLAYRDTVSRADSGVARRLRRAGAVFTGKTNTAEFGQSATTDNKLGPACVNPWDTTRTAGGSSGGAAASVSAGLSAVAIGSDGGGSVRIPASFTGLVGFKPTYGFCPDEGGLRAMSAFSTPGPLARSVADARAVLSVLSDTSLIRADVPALRIGWCAHPEGRPVDAGVSEVVGRAAARLVELGHHVKSVDLHLEGWGDVFGPLVVDEEARERGRLLDEWGDALTSYERRTIEGGRALPAGAVQAARRSHRRYRTRIAAIFEQIDAIALPATAVTAFPEGQRPRVIAHEPADWLWGAFPFTAPWNVGGTPAVSLPCGTVDGMPIGLQLVMPSGRDSALLDLAADVEALLAFDDTPVRRRWSSEG